MEIFRRYKTIEELLPGFLMQKESETIPKTAHSYHTHIYVFIYWLRDNGWDKLPIRKITQDMVTDFFYHLGRDKGLDRPTCEKYVIHIRQLFKYAQAKGELEVLPFDYIVYPRKKKDQGADVIQPVHLKPLLEHIKEKDSQLFLACMMQYYCFIRPGRELRLMKIGDVDLVNGLVVVQSINAKNGQRQVVTMPQQLIDICFEFGMDKADRNHFIFGKKKRFGPKPVSINMLRYRFNVIRDKLELPKTYKLYSFKHTGASALHMSGISMRELMDQLRHSKLEATQHYVKKHIGMVNERIRNNFPPPF